MSAANLVFKLPLRVPWDLGPFKEERFESRIAALLQKVFRGQRDSVRIRRTGQHDRGSDIIIETDSPINLFGIDIPAPAKPPSRIHVECKSTGSPRLRAGFTEDFAQFGDDPPDYYFLVTNGTITPENHWNAVQACRSRRKPIEFKLIDGPLLLAYLQRSNSIFGKAGAFTLPEGIGFEYKPDKELYGSGNVITVYFVVRNLTARASYFELSLATDASWSLEPDRVEVVLEPYGAEVFKLLSHRTLSDKLGDLELRASVDGGSTNIQIGTQGLSFDFEPILSGEAHRRAIDILTAAVDSVAPLSFISISGAAGVGKSRVVDEMLKKRGTAVQHARTYFEPGSDVQAFHRLFSKLKIEGRFDSAESCLEFLVDKFVPDPGDEHVIIFEDLHHASPKLLSGIRNRVVQRKRRALPIRFILTGRNDYSFPNEEYFALVHLLTIPPCRHDCSMILEPLKDDETKTMIRTTIEGVPQGVVERIHKLSENIPFYVTQVIEYLLEVKLVELRTKHTVGLTKGERFFSKRQLPPSIRDIYERRYGVLERAHHGKAAAEILTGASFFGLVIHQDVIESVVPISEERRKALDLLIKRRFLQRQASDGTYIFAHENLLHFIRRRARTANNRRQASRLVLRDANLLANLSPFDRGEVLHLGSQNRQAMEYFRPILDRMADVDNISSENLDVRWFRYLDTAFDVALAMGKAPDILRRMLLAKSYMGIHNNPLMVGYEACNEALIQLERVELNKSAKQITSAKIRQLQAHGLQNMGRTDHARGIMIELDAKVQSDDRFRAETDFLFDLYDRQHALFLKMNHIAAARSYCELAKRVVEKSGNGKLKTCHMITETATDLLRDPALSLVRAKRTHAVALKHGAHRLQVYTRLSICVADFLCKLNQKRYWPKLLDSAKVILSQAAIENLSDSLMRSQLLVGTLIYLLHGTEPRKADLALRHAESGINDSIRFGNGLFIWLFYNLGAVILASRKRHPDQISRYFDTAIEQLDRQSLLFLGNRDVVYPNTFVISNALRYLLPISEKKAFNLVARVRYYEDEYTPERVIEDHRSQIAAFRKSGVLFHGLQDFAVPVDPITGYWVPVM